MWYNCIVSDKKELINFRICSHRILVRFFEHNIHDSKKQFRRNTYLIARIFYAVQPENLLKGCACKPMRTTSYIRKVVYRYEL